MEESGSSTTASGRIFMSYRRQETAYATGWLFDRLAERYGRAQVFKDVDSLQPGDDFVAVIESAVGSCSVLLALIGDEWLTVVDDTGRRRLDDPTDFVRLEIEAALARGVRVIPILVDGARMPKPSEVPDSLGPLMRFQALELSPARFDFDLSQLLAVLDRMLSPAKDPRDASVEHRELPVEPSAAAQDEGRRTSPVAVAGGVLAAVVAILTLVFLLRPDSGGSPPPPGNGGTPPSSSTVVREDSPTPSDTPTGFVVASRGRTRLTDPTQGLDLASGQVVAFTQSQLAWSTLSRQLSVFDETTLGAALLDGASFREVTPAVLAAATYRQGAANPPLSPTDLPAGRVLAVHVADRAFAKVTVVRYGPGDALDLRWVTYRS